jgi:RNA polymerase sigma-70 factor (ECF subfamily)
MDRGGSAQIPDVAARDAAAVPLFEESRTSDPIPVPPDFRRLFDAHFDYVWHVLRRLGVDPNDLEDLTHDVFLTVYRKLDTFDPSRPLRPWLFGFAFRIASDHRRLGRHRRERLGEPPDTRDPAPTALDHAVTDELVGIARSALDALELERRAVFILHELDECPVPEVARTLGSPLNTAYSRLRLARADLRTAVHRLRARGAL